jgi:hypothetical protein
MLRLVCVAVMALALTGCETSQEREQRLALAIDKNDDAICRRQIGPTMPNPDKTYADCRHALVMARMGGGGGGAPGPNLNGLGPAMQDAGRALQNIDPPMNRPMTCTTMPSMAPGLPATTTCR